MKCKTAQKCIKMQPAKIVTLRYIYHIVQNFQGSNFSQVHVSVLRINFTQIRWCMPHMYMHFGWGRPVVCNKQSCCCGCPLELTAVKQYLLSWLKQWSMVTTFTKTSGMRQFTKNFHVLRASQSSWSLYHCCHKSHHTVGHVPLNISSVCALFNFIEKFSQF